jgi:hypothetical protein
MKCYSSFVIWICAQAIVHAYPLERRQTTRSRGNPPLSVASFFASDGPARATESLFTQVISDVDDTLKSSGGVNIAGVALGGIDVQYPRGEMYPGVEEFMLQLSLSTRQDLTTPPPKVAILTARAEEFKLALELKESSSLARAFRQAGEAEGVQGWGLGPVLYGSVAEWIVQDRKGMRKFTNFERLMEQDPSGRIIKYVYVGDTGELDQEAGETMLRDYAPYVKAVFLHCVSGEDGPVHVPAPRYINGRPLIFFRTYVGAAVAAVGVDLMTPGGLARVIQSATERLASVAPESDKWKDLRHDMEASKGILN